MTIERTHQLPGDAGAEVYRRPALDVERINEMADDGEYVEPDEFEVGKAELLRQHREEHFGGDDLAGATDDEIFDAMPKPWRSE